jgi:hypothetical protein
VKKRIGSYPRVRVEDGSHSVVSQAGSVLLVETVREQSGTAQLPHRLIARRNRGPMFLTDRKAPAGTPTLDVCPETGRGRLYCRRAEEIFEECRR